MKIFSTFFLAMLILGCATDRSEYKIEFDKIIEDAESVENFHGMSNIFFQPASEEFTFSQSWKNPEVAILSEPDGFKPVHVLRYETTDDKRKYLADTDSDFDFTDEDKLTFINKNDQSVADVIIQLKSINNEHTLPVNFQIVKIQDWRYGRISEHRQGKISLNGVEYEVKMYPGTRNHPIYESSSWLNFLVDLNKDGKFSDRWQVEDGGSLLNSEKIDVTQLFALNNETFQITSIDSTGKVVSLKRSEQDSAAAEGFNIPNYKTTTLQNNKSDLYTYLDKPTILEFWSTSCPFSEAARPEINQLYESHNDQFNLISTPREKGLDEIENHLESHPKKGVLLLRDEKTWEELNPLPVSPLYYLIDRNGEIIMKAQGASAVKLLKVKLNQMISEDV
jgi:thiol-disulfide isomerase/thioredoxin